VRSDERHTHWLQGNKARGTAKALARRLTEPEKLRASQFLASCCH